MKRHIPLIGLCGTLCMMPVSVLQAQDSASDNSSRQINEVIVIGVKNIDRELSQLKKESFTTTDSLNFEELDLISEDSIGGAISQVAGAAAIVDPTSGQPRFIALRGFGPQYNSIDFDGIPILNSSANNRGVRLDLFPSSLVHELNVFKTVTADQNGNSIGGHASVRSIRAFDGGGQPFFRTKLQGGIYDHDGEPDDNNLSYRFDAVGKFTFGENENFGVVLGLDTQQQQYSRDSQRLNDGYRLIGGIDTPERDTLFNSIVFQTDIERLNGVVKFEVQANEKMYGFLSLHYFSQNEIESRNRTGFFVDPIEATSIDVGTTSYFESQGSISFVDRERIRQTTLIGTGLDYEVGYDGLLSFRASHSTVRLDSSFEQSRSFVSRAGDRTLGDDLTVNFGRDSFSVSLPDSNNFSNTSDFEQEGNSGGTFNQLDELDDTLSTLNLDFSNNLHYDAAGFGYKVGMSGQRINRNFDRSVLRYRLQNRADGLPDNDVDDNSYTLDINNPLLGNSINVFSNVFIDRSAYWAFLKTNNINVGNDLAPLALNAQADYALLEDVYASYGTLSYAWDDLRVIAGLRAEYTKVDSTGFRTDETTAEVVFPDQDTNYYLDLLPSAHLIYSPDRNIKLRLSLTRTLARPDFADFAQRESAEVIAEDGQNILELFVGDTDMESRVANGVDIGGEYYFESYSGFMSAALFYRQINNEHYRLLSSSVTIDTNGVPAETRVSTARDDSKVDVTGFEFNFVMNSLEFLPSAFHNFGLNANYTFTTAKWKLPQEGNVNREIDGLRNQPDHLANIKLRYRIGNLGIDLSTAYRGEYFTGRFGITPANDVYVEDLTRVTLASFYRVSDQFSVHFDVRDLNKPKYVEVTGQNRNLIRRVIESEPAYWVGFKFKL